MDPLDHKICIAPMMTHTDRHFRYFLRLISSHVMLYTEMVTTGALLNGDREKYLAYHPMEHPVAIQLGGNNADDLKHCAATAEAAGFDEINLNVGCPSDRVQSGQFGACLMERPELIADCIAAMQGHVSIPVSVKNRIGIDDQDNYDFLLNFVKTVAEAGCRTFIIHARKAVLSGLTPRQNREIPPLKYAMVHQLKRDFPQLEIIINGGFSTVEQIKSQDELVDGVMIGRAVCNNPYLLADIERDIFRNKSAIPSRYDILHSYTDYIERELQKGTPLSRMSRHILGIFQGHAGARAYRRYLSNHIYRPNSGTEVIKKALSLVKAA